MKVSLSSFSFCKPLFLYRLLSLIFAILSQVLNNIGSIHFSFSLKIGSPVCLKEEMINSLKGLKKPTKNKIDNWIYNFNKKIVTEQEKSHFLAPKAEYMCSNEYLSKILRY